ncbi:protein C3orf33 homolog isoform X1 [Denticeps clupeoides]|uniref:protein C3orf33 homolog isoform X1 n=1 Tax=Denticeps clupeoides TaxID=299321 RepID=UPI0010A323E0|nr:protein C3orf33 homolog isoform X1 [Denticeps clupeoides]
MAEARPPQDGRTDKMNSSNFIAAVSQFADDNLTIVRSISAGLAVAGIIILGRSIRLLTKFKSASEIPAQFVEKNVNLRGKVCGVTDKGLEVEHVPIRVPVLSSMLAKTGHPHAPLEVRLAGVDLTPEGRDWLGKQLTPAETVWLQLIRRDGETLDCLVLQNRGSMFRKCLNEEVLRLGLARTVPILGLDHHSRVFWRLHRRLLKAELHAERKGKGLWKKDSFWSRMSDAFGDNMAVRSFKRIFRWT